MRWHCSIESDNNMQTKATPQLLFQGFNAESKSFEILEIGKRG
jgi:hypothetical protein